MTLIVDGPTVIAFIFLFGIGMGVLCAHLAQKDCRGSSAKNSPAPITTLSGLAYFSTDPTDAEVPQLLEVQL